MSFRQAAGFGALVLVVGKNGVDRFDGIFWGAEPPDARGIGEDGARSRVFDDDGFAGGEEADGAVADPCVLKADARAFDCAELAQ